MKPRMLLDFGAYMKRRTFNANGDRYKPTTIYTKLHSLRRFFGAYNR